MHLNVSLGNLYLKYLFTWGFLWILVYVDVELYNHE